MIKKKPKPYPDLVSEANLGFFHSHPDFQSRVIGVDEVGRGCLAGSVVAAAVLLSPHKALDLGFKKNGERGIRMDHPILRLQDSKLIPEDHREGFRNSVVEFALGYGIGEASVEEIGELNILHASMLAMERAVESLEKNLGIRANHVLVDGNRVPRSLLPRGKAIVKGDQTSLSISCASVIAKVHRDQMMERMENLYPGYGLKAHKGYPTPFHKKQIEILGATPIHRKGFKGVLN